MVTVDCGVTALEQPLLARELGVELIVTDHHEPGRSCPSVPRWSILVCPAASIPSAA